VLTPLPQPRRVGPYRLLAVLGAGGMGEVYLARPVEGAAAGSADGTATGLATATGGLEALVALKTVRQGLPTDEEFLTRFRREIASAGAVRSPYTAALIGGDVLAAPPWLATEYVPGPSLQEAVRVCGPLPPAIVRAMGVHLAEALRAVHGARILHRDLKPANVLLAAAGPKLIDFGIAQAFDATKLTSTGLVIGTPGFMSPEHVDGSGTLTAASDVFCLAALLCHAATGRGPFDDEEIAAIVHRIARADADLTAVPNDSGLRDTLAACLHRDPTERPALEELIRRLGGEPSERPTDRPTDQPTARPAAPTAPFGWPAPVAALLTAHATAAFRAVATAPPEAAAQPQRPPGGGAGGSLPPVAVGSSAVGRSAATPPPERRRTARTAAALAVLGVVVGVLLAVLLPSVLREDPNTRGGGSKEQSIDGSGADSADGAIGGAALPASRSDVRDFGLRALNPSGRPAGWAAWSKDTPALDTGAGCALGRGRLACGFLETGIEVRDPANGAVKWRDAGRKISEQLTASNYTQMTAPVIVGRTVFYYKDGKLIAARLATGEQIWQRSAPVGPYSLTDLLVHDGALHALFSTREEGDGDAKLLSLKVEDGAVRFSRNLTKTFGGTMYAADDRLYLSRDGKAQIRNSDTGALLKESRSDLCTFVFPDQAGRPLCRDPQRPGILRLHPETLAKDRELAPELLPDGRPVVGRDGTLYAYDRPERKLVAVDLASGKERWATAVGDRNELALAGGRVLVVRAPGITEVSRKDGKVLVPERAVPGGEPAGQRPAPKPVVGAGVAYLSYPNGTTGHLAAAPVGAAGGGG
jgi:outer membrane protein assembly factor BamB